MRLDDGLKDYLKQKYNFEFDISGEGIEYFKRNPDRSSEIVFFISGIGLDYSDFIDYCMFTERNVIGLTVPGFEESRKKAKTTFSMYEQATKIASYIKSVFKEYEDNHHLSPKVTVYGFSHGSDLTVEVIDHLIPNYLHKVIFTDINIDQETCFITNQIRDSENDTPIKFITKFLNNNDPDNREVLDTASKKNVHLEDVHLTDEDRQAEIDYVSDISMYFSKIVRKNWEQLKVSSEEVACNPEKRLERLFVNLFRNQNIGSVFVFSSDKDVSKFVDFSNRLTSNEILQHEKTDFFNFSRMLGNSVKCTNSSHFYHITVHGIENNLDSIL